MNESTGEHDDEAPSLATSSAEDGAGKHGLAAGAPEGRGGGSDGTMRQSMGSHPRCRATSKSGAPCESFVVAGTGGYCHAHSGRANMAELGRKGGKQRTRNLLGISDEVADESLRQKARRRLETMLDSGDDSLAIRAATSLYSYRAAPAPDERETREREATAGYQGTNLAGVVRLACELHTLSQGYGVPLELETAMAEALASTKPLAVDAPPLPRPVVRGSVRRVR